MVHPTLTLARHRPLVAPLALLGLLLTGACTTSAGGNGGAAAGWYPAPGTQGDAAETPDAAAPTGQADSAPPHNQADVGGATPDSGPDAVAAAPPVFVAHGALKTVVAGAAVAIGYDDQAAQGQFVHSLTAGACIAGLHLETAWPDGACRLELNFLIGPNKGTLVLAKARFHAIAVTKAGALPCPGWIDENSSDAVVYEGTTGTGNVTVPDVPAGQASAAVVELAGVALAPSGSVVLQHGNRSFALDLTQLWFSGKATSEGQPDLACNLPPPVEPPPPSYPLPTWKFPDVQPKSPGYQKTYGLEAFPGKRIAILMAAGWCNSCIAQTATMEKVRKALEAKGRTDFVMLVLNDASGASQKANLTAKCSFPVFQGGSWKSHVGKDLTGKPHPGAKNDAWVYDHDGRQMGFYKSADPLYLNTFEDFLTMNLDGADGFVGINADGAKPKVGP